MTIMATEKSNQILEEMVQLSVDTIRLCQSVPLPRSVVDQVTRSVTSIGANFSEAQDASSKKDFLNKIYIAKKEASETKYWLAVIVKLSESDKFADVSQQIQKFIMILQKIINTSKEGNRT